jgi:hypothetical protein
MPVHDWTRVDDGIFHAFHVAWIPELSKALNSGLLPEGYYALPEQHAGRTIADVLTLHTPPVIVPEMYVPPLQSGCVAVAQAPPKVRKRETVEHSLLARRRTLAIRHVSGHRLVAMIQILSPANKDRAAVEDFAANAVDALDAGVHLLLVDLFPPGKHDPEGIHGEIRRKLEHDMEPYSPPAGEPLTFASYSTGPAVEVYLEYRGTGAATLPDMPLFFQPEKFVTAPLNQTYHDAYLGMPAYWKAVLA